MTDDIILQIEREQKKRIGKDARKAISFALIICTLVFVFQLLPSLVIGIVLSFLGPSFTLTNLGYIIIQIISYFFYICCPFAIGYFLYKLIKNPNQVPLIKRPSPKMPFLYCFGALGCCYMVNFIFIVLFPKITELGLDNDIVANTPLEIALTLVMYAVLPAILEEWGFRHILLKNLLPYGKWGAIIVSAILFGVGHLHPLSVINAITFGIILGVIYEYTGSIKWTVFIHFLNNAIATIPSLIPEDSPFLIIFSLLSFGIMGVGVIAVIYYAINGYKRKKITLKKADSIGYKLSIPKFINRLIFNYAFIPYAAVVAFFIYIVFVIEL